VARTVARSGGSSAGVVVAGLTAAALVVIGFLTFQASAAQERTGQHAPSASGASSPGASSHNARKRAAALPARSGHGERVVYALRRKRVWLVGANDRVRRNYAVGPSAVSPRPGTYKVESRAPHVTGSDGVPVENVVRFTTVRGTTIGFSAALDGAMPQRGTGGATRKTGGVRERRADGEALWLFAQIGTRIVVVP
jgi:hypothetical protein